MFENKEVFTTISEKTVFRGALTNLKAMIVKGVVIGSIHSTTSLYIADNALIEGNIYANLVFVNGTVKGNIFSSGNIILYSNSIVYGNIYTSKIKIFDGVVFRGICSMYK